MNTRGATKTLLVVGLFGAILAVISPTPVVCILDNSSQGRASMDIRVLESALNLYRLDNLRYPTTEQGLAALITRPKGPDLENWTRAGYLERLPMDPWGNDYLYASPGKHGEIDIYTLGRDGRIGGDGIDGTIGNWNLFN